MRRPSPRLKEFAQVHLGSDLSWLCLAGDGSERFFWRVGRGEKTQVAVDGSNLEHERLPENRSFLLIGRHLRAQGLPVPRILAHQAEEGLFIVEDLGDDLLSLTAKSKKTGQRLKLYQAVIDVLIRLQREGADGFDPSWCCQTPVYDQEMILAHEAGYFVRAFAQEYCGQIPDTDRLAGEMARLAERAAAARPRLFLHRDFQSRNIILQADRVRIIDFQAGRLGPPGYDLASLLIDPYVGLSQEEQEGLLDYYLRGTGLEEERFRRDYSYLALCRNLQMLGAFGYLTRVKGRAGFDEHIPSALANLRGLLARCEFDSFPALRALVAGLRPEEGER